MEPVQGKRIRDEGSLDNASGALKSKRARSLPLMDPAKIRREEERRKIEEKYADLPPLPPRIPAPEYLVHGQGAYSKDDASLQFYAACARGDLDKVRSFAENSRPPYADLQ